MVDQIRGLIKGQTLLPFPPVRNCQIRHEGIQTINSYLYKQGIQNIEAEEIRARESKGKDVNTTLKNNIEAIILKWSYQVRKLVKEL